MWNALAAIQLIQPFLHSCQELNSCRDVVERRFIRQFTNGIEHQFFLCHGGSIGFGRLIRKLLTVDQLTGLGSLLHVVIHRELVRMRAEAERVVFFLFHLAPVRDEVGVEDVAFKEEIVVLA